MKKNNDRATGEQSAGREIMPRPSRPVRLGRVHPAVRKTLVLGIEVIVGFAVICAAALALAYYRLDYGKIDLSFLVPSIEKSINSQLTGLSIKIETAFIGKNVNRPGVHFRLQNIVLFDKNGEAIANAPLAALDLNGQALMWGRIAPSEVVFIKPTIDIAYREGGGFSLSYASSALSGDMIGDLIEGMSSDTGNRNSSKAVRSIDKVDVMKAVTAAFEEARSHRNTTSYLTQFGVRDATVNFVNKDNIYSVNVPDFIIDLRHNNKLSVIRGFGRLGIAQANSFISPWKLRFRTQQFDGTKDLQLDLGFNDISVSSLNKLVKGSMSLDHFDIPLSGKLNAKLDHVGVIQSAFANIKMSTGKITIPWLEGHELGNRFPLDIGELKFAYSNNRNIVHLLPSDFRWGENSAQLSGIIEPPSSSDRNELWKFALRAENAKLAASEFGLKPMIVDEWWIKGRFSPEQKILHIDKYLLRAGNAKIQMTGHIDIVEGAPAIYLNGDISSVSLPVMKRLWPSIFAVNARQWIGERIHEGRISSGHFKIALPAETTRNFGEKTKLTPEMIRLDLDLDDLVVTYVPGIDPMRVPEAGLQISGRQMNVVVPKGKVALDGGRQLSLSHGSFSIHDLRPAIPPADINFHISGAMSDLIGFLNQPGFDGIGMKAMSSSVVSGKIDGVVSMNFPLVDDLKFSDINLAGDLRLTKMKSGPLFSKLTADGGTVNIKLSNKDITADGGIVIGGIPAKISWQRELGKTERSPSLRLSVVLNRKGRKKLHLEELNRYIEGDIPLVVTVKTLADDKKLIQARADLTNCAVVHQAFGWSKGVGEAAVLQFDINETNDNRVKLDNLDLVTNDLVLEGNIILDSRNGRINEFAFPKITYKQHNNLAVTGARAENGIFLLKADVKSLDGRAFLRNQIFQRDDDDKTVLEARKRMEYDLVADIERIVGGHGTYIADVKMDAKSRKGHTEWLNFRGKLNDEAPIALRLQREDGSRVLKAESRDAGATLRMLGLFPHIESGQLSFRLDVDRKGRRKKQGTLWLKSFRVVTEQNVNADISRDDVFKQQIVKENTSRGRRYGRRKIRTKIKFNRLKAPFSYGNGQFLLHNSYVNGPVLGATLRGKIDFRRENIRLAGTYVPLYGLNSAIDEIPVLRELLVGRKGEGVFGVTFAIEGHTANPTVIVNPVSLLTPGVFRQIFDFNDDMNKKKKNKTNPFPGDSFN